jgi:hypothetical protein
MLVERSMNGSAIGGCLMEGKNIRNCVERAVFCTDGCCEERF